MSRLMVSMLELWYFSSGTIERPLIGRHYDFAYNASYRRGLPRPCSLALKDPNDTDLSVGNWVVPCMYAVGTTRCGLTLADL